MPSEVLKNSLFAVCATTLVSAERHITTTASLVFMFFRSWFL